jgi:hypothetical protein
MRFTGIIRVKTVLSLIKNLSSIRAGLREAARVLAQKNEENEAQS